MSSATQYADQTVANFESTNLVRADPNMRWVIKELAQAIQEIDRQLDSLIAARQ
jgi:hypothetical protein